MLPFGLLSAAIFCSSASAQDYTDMELEALEMIREADWGVTRVYIDLYEFYYDPPADLITPEYEWRCGSSTPNITWRSAPGRRLR